MNDNLRFKGSVRLLKTDVDGNTFVLFEDNNLIVNLGKGVIAARLTADGPRPTHIGVGTGNTATSSEDTDLVTALGSRKAATPGVTTTTVNGDTAVFTATFAPGESTGTWQEAGLFTAISGGALVARILTGAQSKGVLDTFSLIWNIQAL